MIYHKKKGISRILIGFFFILLFLTSLPLYANQSAYEASTPPSFSWGGPYVGGYIGGGFVNANLETTIGSPTGSPYFSSSADIASVSADIASVSADIASVSQSGTNLLYPNSAIAGIQFGDNFVVSRLVMVGVVLDYGYFHLNETNSASNVAYPSSSGNYSLQTSVTTNWLYTVRGRVGLMLPPS